MAAGTPTTGDVSMILSVRDPTPIMKMYGIRNVIIHDKTTGTWLITIDAKREDKNDLCADENVYGLEFDNTTWKNRMPIAL